MKCPYCTGPARKVSGRVVYPHLPRLDESWYYQCAPCDAYVGCHPGTEKPLGTLANKELRRVRLTAHQVFDRLWKEGKVQRSKAYGWLAGRMGIPKRRCHFGMFDIDQCRKAIEIVRLRLLCGVIKE